MRRQNSVTGQLRRDAEPGRVTPVTFLDGVVRPRSSFDSQIGGANEDRLIVRGPFDHMRDDASHIVSCTAAECLTDESLGALLRVAR
jgi:hypothetical protein